MAGIGIECMNRGFILSHPFLSRKPPGGIPPCRFRPSPGRGFFCANSTIILEKKQSAKDFQITKSASFCGILTNSLFYGSLLFAQKELPLRKTEGDVYGSHIKPVVGFAAVQADLFASHDANPVCTDAFAAAFAGVGIEQLYLHNPGRGIN